MASRARSCSNSPQVFQLLRLAGGATTTELDGNGSGCGPFGSSCSPGAGLRTPHPARMGPNMNTREWAATMSHHGHASHFGGKAHSGVIVLPSSAPTYVRSKQGGHFYSSKISFGHPGQHQSRLSHDSRPGTVSRASGGWHGHLNGASHATTTFSGNHGAHGGDGNSGHSGHAFSKMFGHPADSARGVSHGSVSYLHFSGSHAAHGSHSGHTRATSHSGQGHTGGQGRSGQGHSGQGQSGQGHSGVGTSTAATSGTAHHGAHNSGANHGSHGHGANGSASHSGHGNDHGNGHLSAGFNASQVYGGSGLGNFAVVGGQVSTTPPAGSSHKMCTERQFTNSAKIQCWIKGGPYAPQPSTQSVAGIYHGV